MEVDESVEFVKMIEDKIDIIQCSVGSRRNSVARGVMHPGRFMPQGCNLYAAEAMKRAGIKIPVATVGGINDPAWPSAFSPREGRPYRLARSLSPTPTGGEGPGRQGGGHPPLHPLHALRRHRRRPREHQHQGDSQDFKTATRHIECSVNPKHGRPGWNPTSRPPGSTRRLSWWAAARRYPGRL